MAKKTIEQIRNEHIIACQLGQIGDDSYVRIVLRFEDNALFIDASRIEYTHTNRRRFHSVIHGMNVEQLRALHQVTSDMLTWIDSHKYPLG